MCMYYVKQNRFKPAQNLWASFGALHIQKEVISIPKHPTCEKRVNDDSQEVVAMMVMFSIIIIINDYTVIKN